LLGAVGQHVDGGEDRRTADLARAADLERDRVEVDVDDVQLGERPRRCVSH
jgi:hypothetical protein